MVFFAVQRLWGSNFGLWLRDDNHDEDDDDDDDGDDVDDDVDDVDDDDDDDDDGEEDVYFSQWYDVKWNPDVQYFGVWISLDRNPKGLKQRGPISRYLMNSPPTNQLMMKNLSKDPLKIQDFVQTNWQPRVVLFVC